MPFFTIRMTTTRNDDMPKPEHRARKLAAILAADVVSYSRMMELDEEGTLVLLNATRREILEPAIAAHGGRIFKTMGDGFLCEFQSAIGAVRCAISIQQSLTEHAQKANGMEAIRLRIGINLGDVMLDDDDIFGDGVNVAARLEQAAQPGGICISATAYETVRIEFGDRFQGGTEVALKNIERPVKAWHWRGPGSQSEVATQERADEEEDRPTVAVIPPTNLSSDHELNFLANSLADDIINLLSRTPGFLVIARQSTMAYRGGNTDVKLIGRDLEARYVVDGTIRPLGESIRITIQLIDAATGNQLWAEHFDRSAAEMLELQDEATAKIVASLHPELTLAEVELGRRTRPRDDAWALYREASITLYQVGWNRGGFQAATDLYRESIEKDPGFALSHAALSLTLAIGHMLGFLTDAEEAFREADLALDLTSNDSEVLGYAGCAISDLGEHDRSIEILERAVELNPSNAQAWTGLGGAYLAKGDFDRAVKHLSHGIRISPVDPRLAMWGTMLAVALGGQGNIEEGIAEARTACKRDQQLYNARLVLAILLAKAGRTDEAKDALAHARRLWPELSMREAGTLAGDFGIRALKGIWGDVEIK